MQKKALVIIDLQNDITKNYKSIIDNVNRAIDWAVSNEIHVDLQDYRSKTKEGSLQYPPS